jgi:hypothetical protein
MSPFRLLFYLSSLAVLVDGKSLSYDWTVSFSHRAPLALTKQVLQSFLTSFVLASVHVLENLFHFSVQVFSFLFFFLFSIMQVIVINDQFPGPLLNATTNDVLNINVHNNLTEPFLMTWYAFTIKHRFFYF